MKIINKINKFYQKNLIVKYAMIVITKMIILLFIAQNVI